ncbi:MAG: bifunctional folylpolyglutamate synthase/dihydrofolate synthase [Oscillospiraceae bacterium]|nr:bifunctional folylpolyglutamate synthase/dihydrofolate synthase [Oscillospiraceae bacterium]
MTYEQALGFIHGIPRFPEKPGLRRIKNLLGRIGNPQDKLSFIHVAGTNGKGSTCTMLSNIMQDAGYKTGLYISPFVLEFGERIQINGRMIPREILAEITAEIRGHWLEMDREGEAPSEFEVVMAIALLYFLRESCDIVVLEVGMGGRFDSTNAIAGSLVSVITGIGMDHMEYLGDTIGKIAMEKCGILKPGGVCVSSPGQNPQALAVIREQAAAMGNPLFIPGEAEVLSMGITGSRIRYSGLELEIPLAGPHQIENAQTAIEACRAMGMTSYDVKDTHIISGIARTSFPCRMERFGPDSNYPLVIIDGAHNEPGAKVLGEALKLLNGVDIHAAAGVGPEKDAQSIFAAVLPHCKSAALGAAGFKASPPEKLLPIARKYCADVTAVPGSGEAFAAALARCKPGDVLLVFGSLFFASEVRQIVTAETDAPRSRRAAR